MIAGTWFALADMADQLSGGDPSRLAGLLAAGLAMILGTLRASLWTGRLSWAVVSGVYRWLMTERPVSRECALVLEHLDNARYKPATKPGERDILHTASLTAWISPLTLAVESVVVAEVDVRPHLDVREWEKVQRKVQAVVQRERERNRAIEKGLVCEALVAACANRRY